MTNKAHVYVGLDLGQRRDYSALAVLERAEALTGEFDPVYWVHKRRTEYTVQHLERMRLGTPYPAVAGRVADVVRQLAAANYVTLVVDAGGPGMAVVDLLRAKDLPCTLLPVMITGGITEGRNGTVYAAPRSALMHGLKSMVQQGVLRIPDGLKETATLLKELGSLKEKGGGTEHDDLAFALALAAWRARKVKGSNGAKLDEVLPHY